MLTEVQERRMSLAGHAAYELGAAGLTSPDADYGGLAAQSALSLVTILARQGHSGGSAAATIQLFNRLARRLPLTPLTGADDEWVKHEGSDLLQNIRCTRILKNAGGVAFDVDTGSGVTFPHLPEIA